MCECVCVYVFYLPEQRSHSDLYILLSAPAMHSSSIIHNAHKHFRTKKNCMKENGTLPLYNLDRASEVHFILFIQLIIFYLFYIFKQKTLYFLYIIFFFNYELFELMKTHPKKSNPKNFPMTIHNHIDI